MCVTRMCIEIVGECYMLTKFNLITYGNSSSNGFTVRYINRIVVDRQIGSTLY